MKMRLRMGSKTMVRERGWRNWKSNLWNALTSTIHLHTLVTIHSPSHFPQLKSAMWINWRWNLLYLKRRCCLTRQTISLIFTILWNAIRPLGVSFLKELQTVKIIKIGLLHFLHLRNLFLGWFRFLDMEPRKDHFGFLKCFKKTSANRSTLWLKWSSLKISAPNHIISVVIFLLLEMLPQFWSISSRFLSLTSGPLYINIISIPCRRKMTNVGCI